MYYKTLGIRNAWKVYRFCTKLVPFVLVTNFYWLSLLQNPHIMMPQCYIVQAPVVLKRFFMDVIYKWAE